MNLLKKEYVKMSIGNIIYTLLIGPLEVLFRICFVSAFNLTNNPAFSIFVLSLIMNLILLPLYRRTDSIQAEAIRTEQRIKPYITHIKKTFKGNEQFMMLQTCYRQNHYKPVDAMKGLAPLILEIPFFMAAYSYLSKLTLLHFCSFGPIANLGEPDQLLSIGSVTINVLPVIMTCINILSSMIYTKGAPLKTKLQLYGMAALFLILLYNSPSGLTFYWTLNNLFSLIKNIIMKLKNPLLVVSAVASPSSLILAILLAIRAKTNGLSQATVLLLVFVMNIPLLIYILKKHRKSLSKEPVTITPKDTVTFITGGIILSLLTGLLIPSSLINSSPKEFILPGLNMNPNIFYVFHTFLLATGAFLIWAGLFYALATSQAKKKMGLVIWILCGTAIVNHMCFGKNYGNLSSILIFDNGVQNTKKDILINLLILAICIVFIILIYRKKIKLLNIFGLATIVAMLSMSVWNITQSQPPIKDGIRQLNQSQEADRKIFTLSKHGKNVVILMMDRAINSFVPYIFNELPELREQFSGFTYYPNTLSFGGHTLFGLPGLAGGYEYMPSEIDKRDTVPLAEKHNEALKVLPVLFEQNGYHVSVCDPAYAGYSEIPDLTIYDDYPDIETHITMKQDNTSINQTQSDLTQRKMPLYSIMKTAPLFLQKTIYNNGNYLNLSNDLTYQSVQGNRSGIGRNLLFEESYNVLRHLPELTQITDNDENNFQAMCNDTTHTPVLLQLPDYDFADSVDNTPYDHEETAIRTDSNGTRLELQNSRQIMHYHCNAASYIEIGNWLDFLKENDVYDNTRIIIVSDHGSALDLYKNWKINTIQPEGGNFYDLMFYNPVLFVKDFNSTELKTDTTFMTNADTPSIALSGLIENPVNPFTGHKINTDAKNNDELYISLSCQYSPASNCGNTFNPDPWAKFTGKNIFDKDNWESIQPEDLP